MLTVRQNKKKLKKLDTIEVFDVLFSSNRFLQIVDKNRADILQRREYFEHLKELELIR
jgi:hypothetical protein